MKKINFRNWRNVVLILLAVGLIFFALSGYMTPYVDRITKPLMSAQEWFTTRFQTIYDLFAVPQDTMELRAENQMLQDQVAQLQTQIIQLQQDIKEADILYALLGFARGRPEEKYIAASVIGKDPSPFLKYILVDKGTDDGVLYGMPVVTDKGLVGRITAVTASAARVQLITDSASKVNVVIEGINEEGVVQGSITGDLSIEMVSSDAKMLPGQAIQTTGLGGTYPADIVVGQVLNVDDRSDLFKSASVQPAEDFGSLQAVLVVSDYRVANIAPLEEEPTQ